MQFDDFDKKIQEAAEHHHPAYEEKAWDQMEKLLDKHLPVEKDDRRRIIFLLLFLLLGGLGVYLGISKPWQQKRTNTTSNDVSVPLKEKSGGGSTENLTKEKNNEPADKTSLPKKEVTTETEKESSALEENKPVGKVKENGKPAPLTLQANPGEQRQTKETAVSNYSIKKAKNKVVSNNYLVSEKVTHQKNRKNKIVPVSNEPEKTETQKISRVANDNSDNHTIKDSDKVASDKPADNTSKIDQLNIPAVANNDSASKTKATDTTAEQKKEETIAQKANAKPKPAKKSKSAFAITFTTGPDLSTVGMGDAGKVKLTYGAGLSYTLNRFTFRSGFYVAKKVYTAGPGDYHPPQHYWTYYVDLTKVDADCKVYEIPLTISYTFSEARNHSWFASTGLSSYLMKEETYGYYYKDRTTQMPEYKEWTLKNGENHIFSVLNLSAGYERKFNKTLSLIAEPYLKIPMDGIGYGKINLNSVGVLFTLSVKPFVRK